MPSIPMPIETGRRERKRTQTLDHLAATAFALFEQHGYDAVTMEQIAAQADVSKGTLYNHFPVKEALLAHQFHTELAAGGAQLRPRIESQPDFSSRLSVLLSASADWCNVRRPYLAPYFRYRFASADLAARERDADKRSGLEAVFTALIGTAQQSGELDTRLDAEHLAGLFEYLYLGALMRWLARPEVDLHEAFAAIINVFLHGVGRKEA
ncbi:TetR/AcrR family transcriptional regulator [Ralstonia sp. UBA689]|uniref:TetR/AcrR family transcriptional regulator n=1 Tax=Ralstonia sp. UBA689 TaxID=1947373 RepID=UPI0025F154E4|nr:TetR/AcrR family transcriptional regulator [Ralstonia sp. UBA689]